MRGRAATNYSQLHLVFDDHAGQTIGDDGIDGLEFFLLLERLGGVAHHEVADGAIEVIGRLARVEGNCFLMKCNSFLCASSFGKRNSQAVVRE